MPAVDENQRRLEAFLSLIRYAEGGKHDRADAYTRLYGGSHFGGFSNHPRKTVDKWHHRSTAAGAYGITEKTYDEAIKGNAAHDFSERSQDAIAVWLITHGGAGAQWDIYDGKSEIAFIKLNHIWSSLPGGSQQELSIEEAQRYFWGRLGEAPP